MRIKSIFVAILGSVMTVGGASSAARADRAAEPATIIMFGASWCAPCLIELSEIAALAKAAAPNRLEIAWIDRAPRINGAPANVAILSPSEARRKFQAAAGGEPGLPVTVMLTDDGRPCSILRQPATAAGVQRLISQCKL